MKTRYVSPKLIQEEVHRMNTILEYDHFIDEAEDDKDQLTMDDFNAPAGGPPPGGDAPPAGGPPPPGTPDGTPPAGGPPADQPAGGDVENPFDNPGADDGSVPPEGGDMGGDPTQEIDVTDIVNDTKAVSQKSDEIGSKVDQTLTKVDSLMAKIAGLEQSVQKMDQVVSKIDAIYKEVELSKPPSPDEVKEVMAQNSYPFNVTLDAYNKGEAPKNQTDLEQRKNKLSLSNLLSDFNERELRQSFNPPDPFDDKLSRSLPGYRV